MAKPLVFLGTYLNLRRFYDIAQSCGYEVAGIVDHAHYNNQLTNTFQGIPVIGTPNTFFNDPDNKDRYCFFLSRMFPEPNVEEKPMSWSRLDYINLINTLDLECISLIAPTAQLADTVELGRGSYVGGNCVIGNYVELKDFCQIHENSLISDHSVVGVNTNIQRRVTFVGHTKIGNNCQIGLETMFGKNNVTIGDDAIVQSGFIIARDIAPGEVVHLSGRILKKIYPKHRIID